MDELSRVRLARSTSAPMGLRGVNLYDKNARLLAAVAVRPDGSPGIGMFDGTGKVRLSLDSGQRGEAPGLSLYDRSGTMRAAMAVRPDDTPGVGLFDVQGTGASLASTAEHADARRAQGLAQRQDTLLERGV